MAVEHRISVSFDDREFKTLERLSAHTHQTKAALIRTIVEEFLRDNPDRFRRKTTVNSVEKRKRLKRSSTNVLLQDEVD